MEDLFLKSASGLLPIEDNIASKYALKKGGNSPFTTLPISDSKGDTTAVIEKHEVELNDDIENSQIFSVAEALDISAGADS